MTMYDGTLLMSLQMFLGRPAPAAASAASSVTPRPSAAAAPASTAGASTAAGPSVFQPTAAAVAPRSPGNSTVTQVADQLATACGRGDIVSAKAAVALGASVHAKGMSSGYGPLLPLEAAVAKEQASLVVWLLSLGADPNGEDVMWAGAQHSSASTLQLLIDVGGDTNRADHGGPPLFTAITSSKSSEEKVRLLLADPSLDLTKKYKGKTPEEYAHHSGTRVMVDSISREVSVSAVSGSW